MDNIAKVKLGGKIGGEMFTIVDAEDLEIVNKYRWYKLPNGSGEIYAATRYVDPETKKRTTLLLHRLIVKAGPKELIDHKNRKTLDNRKSNLRLCTPQQNVGNIEKNVDNTSGYKGVTLYVNKKKKIVCWRARINFKRKEHVTYHKTKEEAARSYDKMAKDFYGEFACTNEDMGLCEKKKKLPQLNIRRLQ